MKLGRNEACPCGSGKKYKKCCINAKAPIAAELNPPAAVEPDEEDVARIENKKFWATLKAGDFDERAAIVESIMDDPDRFEDYDSVDFFDALHTASETPEHRQVFKRLMRKLKQEYPAKYETKLGYLISFCIDHALTDGHQTEAENLFLEFAANASADIDFFNGTLNRMIYHSNLDLLLDAMHRGWENVKNSSDIIPWAIDEYAHLAAEYEIFKFITEKPDSDPTDPEFLKKLEKFINPDIEKLQVHITDITGKSGRVWQTDDFNYQIGNNALNRKQRDSTAARKPFSLQTFSTDLSQLTREFLGYLTREEGVSHPKADVVQSELFRYFVERAQGELEEQPSLFERYTQPQSKQKPIANSYDHILYPDNKTLDRFLGGLVGFLGFRKFRAIIVFESIPAWLRFLESKGLITYETRLRTVSSIYELHGGIKKIIEREGDDKQRMQTRLEKAYRED